MIVGVGNNSLKYTLKILKKFETKLLTLLNSKFIISFEFNFFDLKNVINKPVVTHADTINIPRVAAANLKWRIATIKMIAPMM